MVNKKGIRTSSIVSAEETTGLPPLRPATGGNGGIFDGGEGLDPLISAYSLNITDDHRFVLATNAGSNSVSVMRVNPDLSLSLAARADTRRYRSVLNASWRSLFTTSTATTRDACTIDVMTANTQSALGCVTKRSIG